jgi:hypothetical protein
MVKGDSGALVAMHAQSISALVRVSNKLGTARVPREISPIFPGPSGAGGRRRYLPWDHNSLIKGHARPVHTAENCSDAESTLIDPLTLLD